MMTTNKPECSEDSEYKNTSAMETKCMTTKNPFHFNKI